MKRFHIYIVSVALLLLSACSSDNDELPGGSNNTLPAALRIEVNASDFADANGISTRVTNNGSTTTFENGDRIGITVLDNSGNVLSDNIPYIYSGTSWSFDTGNGEGKTAIYYDNKAGTLTYLAYFPYSTKADQAKSKDDLKTKFQPKSDQRSKESYRTSDLLVWSKAATADALPKKLEIEFKHAYSSFALSSIEIKCNLAGGSSETTYSSSLISDVSFTLNGEPYSAYKAEDGSYRIITVPQSSGVSARWFYTYNAKTYNGTVSVNTLVEEHRYTLAPSLNLGDYSLDKAKMGDFYCKSSDGSTGYLIPREIAELSDDQRNACLGIVMKVGKDDSGDWKDEDSYKLKNGTTEMPTIYGYVLALKDGNSGNTCTWGSDGEEIHTDQAQYTLFCGYKNTQKIKDYVAANEGKTLQNDFPAAYHASEGYETREDGKYSSPSNSSGWFLPSAGQCWYWNQNKVLLKESMDKVGGDVWYANYWSSSEGDRNPADYVWCVEFRYDTSYRDAKNWAYDYRVRSSLAF